MASTKFRIRGPITGRPVYAVSFDEAVSVFRYHLLHKLIPSMGVKEATDYLNQMQKTPTDAFKAELKALAKDIKVNIMLGGRLAHEGVTLTFRDPEDAAGATVPEK